MRFSTFLTAASSLALNHVVRAAHGDGDEGTIMGPVAFLWPDDRKWDASNDNIGPCGSSDGVVNRTDFPLTQGSVALSIADDAYKVAFYVAFNNYPTSQVQFVEQVVNNVTEIDPGHQCYKIDPLPDTVAAGSNATIQLQYWATYGSENDGQNQTFYACADITFVETADFDIQVPCFNVTAEDFDAGNIASTTSTAATATATSSSTSTGSAAAATTTSSSSSATASASSGGGGLSGGAKAGIAVGSVIGGIAILGLAGFLFWRRRRTGYTGRAQRAAFNDPIPLAKRNAESVSVN